MAYTTAQLVTLYTNANLGKAPDAATSLTLDAYATQSQTGGISDATALNNTLKLVGNTTAVAVETYQFFTGHAPSAAGLAYLVNSTTNTNDLNDAYYSKFAQENRFINFSINLATGAGEGATAFAAAYGAVSYQQTVASAYDKIIGNAVATAAGVDVAAAVAYLSRAENITYLTAFVKANTGLTAAADIDLAVKAALIGEILNAATASGLGGYATATAALVSDLSDGTLSTDNSAGINLFTAYPSSGTAGSTLALTTSVDTVVGTANNDTINATISAAATTTLTNLDSIDGAGGTDTLNITDVVGGFSVANVLGLSVKNVETANIISVGALTADTTAWTGLAALNTTSVGGATVTGSATTAISATDAALAAATLTVNGGSTVNATTTTAGNGQISIGATTASAGAVTVKATVNGTGALTQGVIGVKGGTSVNITTVATQATVNTTTTQAAITVTGTSATKDVTVTETAKVTADATHKGIALGAVVVNDVNGAHATKAGTIGTVSVTNAASLAFTGNSLATLNLTGEVGAVGVTSGAGATTTALALNLGKGTTGTITSAQYKTINVTTSGANTVANIAEANATALNVAGSAVLTLTSAAGLSALATATVTGSAGLKADLSGIASVTKVDTSGTTGTSTVSVDATKGVTYAGGAGSDYLTLVGALKTGTSVTLGAGDDRLLGATAITASTTSVVDGGAGTDTVSSTLINAGNGDMFKNFEVLGLGANTLDASLLTGSTITSLELGVGGGTGTFSNVTAAQSLSVTGTAAAGTTTLTFTGVAGTADAYAIGFKAVGSTDSTAPTTVDAKIVSIEGIENVTVNSGSASGFTSNVIALKDAAAKTLTVTGDQDISITFDTNFGTSSATNGVTKIDASAVTGAVTLDTTHVNIPTGGSLIVTTGSGDDSLTLTTAATVSTGAGDDTIVLGGASTVDAGAGDDTITTSAHASTITLGGGTDSVDVTLSVGATTFVTIADTIGAGDSLTFKDQGTEVFNTTKVDVSSATTLTDALNLAAAGNGGVNGIISWFQYGGNTYIVEDNSAGATFGAADIVVKLTGAIDLATAAGAGTNVITLV